MNDLISRCGSAVDRTIKFLDDHPIDPPLASITELLTELGGIRAGLNEFAGDQDYGQGEFRGGSTNRRLLATELRALMRPINKLASSVKPTRFPGLREQFRMPSGGSYPRLIARAEAFLTAIGRHKAVFVDRGMDEDIDLQLQAKKDALVAITGRKNTGLSQRIEGTANLKITSREALAVLKELDAILSYRYRNDPGLLAAWKGACRVERDPVYDTEAEAAVRPAGLA